MLHYPDTANLYTEPLPSFVLPFIYVNTVEKTKKPTSHLTQIRRKQKRGRPEHQKNTAHTSHKAQTRQ